ncbi:hypothetical protein SAMN05192575_101602 [Nocardioides alpinus]|uniref:Uncharacterized protein n=1 Tax=Nocardioides alpinus TaxID=748909 RepID=A0A1I0W0B6_9ACTN|nr:hypothetical protein [Nocardioides alpinus]PKH37600.1 hypothetical protein CXG46_19395 [Nocardioides alpinus]SFA82031.1 hypothetical protein SAMN05192575_101602 [Nocardioides alpinus]
MTDYQRIHVVTTQAGAADVERLRAHLRSSAVVVTAPTAEAKQVVQGLGRDAHPDVLLAPVRFPDVDRGHRLDALVRRHAVEDRFCDVVVVADPATVVLLLRVLAPDQLASGGPVTEVGLPRGPRPVPLGQAAIGGGVLAFVTLALSTLLPVWLLPALVALVGLALLVVPGRRYLGQTLLIALGASLVVGLLAIAGSDRFPGAW